MFLEVGAHHIAVQAQRVLGAVRAQEAANSFDNEGRKEGIRQFIDEKSYKPGLGAYDLSKQKA